MRPPIPDYAAIVVNSIQGGYRILWLGNLKPTPAKTKQEAQNILNDKVPGQAVFWNVSPN